MYLRQDHIPSNIPYQRAVILFDHGRETLLVQSKYEAPGLEEDAVGWVIPVPNLPDVTTVAADDASTMFWVLSDISYPTVTRFFFGKTCFRVSVAILLLSITYMLLMPIIVFVQCILDKSFKPMKRVVLVRRRWLLSYIINFFVALLFFVAVPNFITYRGNQGVDVIEEKDAGIYNIKVIRSDQGESLISWLNSNGFKFNTADQEVFDYFTHKNWYFVAARIKVQDDSDNAEVVSEGLAAPLILGFDTEQPVYPLKLTGTAGGATKILLYIYAQNTMQCDERMEMQFADESGFGFFNSILANWFDNAEEAERLFEQFVPISENGYLTKCTGTLQSEQMKSDMYFIKAEENTPYRKEIRKIL